MKDNKKYIQIAINEAYKNLGNTFPNPSVGCVLVKNNKIINKSVTGISGSPHAERRLFNFLTIDQTESATLYVTLEPCNHHGKNLPCTDIIIEHKIKKVVIGCVDPNKIVSGKGIDALRQNNIEVEVLNDHDALHLHRYFNYYIATNKPYITAKLAVSIDGKIALKNGDSKWITNRDSRNLVHLMRSWHDAVMTSIGTVKADDPELNCRIKGYQKERIVIILDKNLEIPENAKLITRQNKSPLWIITSEIASLDKIKKLKSLGVRVDVFPLKTFSVNFSQILEFIASQGITSIFCETGSFVTKLYKEKLINELIIFRAQKIMGNDSKSMIGDLSLGSINYDQSINLTKEKLLYSGDRVEFYEFK